MPPVLRRHGFHAIGGLPVATLDLAGVADAEAYLQRLSGATHKDLRRKLKYGGGVRIEHRHDITGLAGEIRVLYESTRRHSTLSFGDF